MGGKNTTENKVEMKNTTANGGSDNNVRKNSGNRVNVILVLIIVILLGVVGFMAHQFLQEDEDDRNVHDGRGTFVSSENVDQIKDSMNDKIEGASYTACMNVDWNFYNGKAASTNAYVENVKENTHTVFFDVRLQSTGEVVYSSPYLPLGAKLEKFALAVDLSAGDYPAIVTYVLVDEEYNEISSVSVAVTIHVLN